MIKQLSEFRVLPTQNQVGPVALLVGVDEAELPQRGFPQEHIRLETLPCTLIHAMLSVVHQVEFIVTPLFGQHCDALEVVQELARVGFAGQIYVIVPTLPNPEVIRRELACQSGDIRIEFIRDTRH